MQLIFPLLLVIAWWRIEFRKNHSSDGIGSVILGCVMFGFGAVNLEVGDKLLLASIVAVGLFIALIGLGRFIIHEIKS